MAYYDLLLKNGTLVNQEGEVCCDVAISGDKIVALGDLNEAHAKKTLNCRGLHLLPGVIDTQVHFREPGLEHKESLAYGARAAVAGGVCGVFEMPNTIPPTTTEALFSDKMKRAQGKMACNYAFYMGGTIENSKDLETFERLPGCAGIKVFLGSSTGSLLLDTEEGLDRVLQHIRYRAAFHSEDERRLKERLHLREEGNPRSHTVWRDPKAALRSTQRLVRLAFKHQKKVHVLHVSTAEEIDFLAQNKAIASVEVTPHHLLLDADEAYARLGTLVQMNPPIREKIHQEALWKGIDLGIVDVLGSDHAPHTLEEKAKPYPNTPSGMPGVQTLLPLMLQAVSEGKLSLQRLVSLTSAKPAALFGILGKGMIFPGFDADISVVDLQRSEKIENKWIESLCKWTPYDGISVRGWPVGTLVGGEIAMWQGEISEKCFGKPMKFKRAGEDHV